MPRVRKVAGIALVATLLSVLPAVSALASDQPNANVKQETQPMNSHDPTIDPRMRAQIPLKRASGQLKRFIDAQRVKGLSAFAFEGNDQRLVMYWKGDVPAGLQRLIEELRANNDFAIEVRSAAFTESEVVPEARRIAGLSPDEAGGAHLRGAGPNGDFSAIRVLVSKESEIEPARSAIESPFPLTFAVGSMYEAGSGGRWDDEPPFWGGASIFRDPGGEGHCTLGFGVRRINGGDQGMLTARHCGINVDWYTFAVGGFVGTSGSGDISLDTTIIDGADTNPEIDTYGASVYTGDWRSANNAPISGGENPKERGELVIVQGSGSGSCVMRVNQLNQFRFTINSPDQQIGPAFISDSLDGEGCVGNGDSGAPVVAPGQTPPNLRARGMYDAGNINFLAPCQGEPESDIRRCSSRALSINIDAIKNQHNIVLQSGDAN